MVYLSSVGQIWIARIVIGLFLFLIITSLLYSLPCLSIAQIHEMTKELDLLLRSIEEAGGFKDTCTRSLRSAVEELELGMKSLSEICKTWMVMFLSLYYLFLLKEKFKACFFITISVLYF